MYGGSNYQRQPMGMGGGTPPPKDLMILIAVLFFTFTLQFFQPTSIIPALMQLSPAVWQLGFLWQLGTYAFAGHGAPSLWFLLSLLMIFWFGRDVCRAMGRKQFWILMAWGIGCASVVAVLTHILMHFVGGPGAQAPFGLMQGQNIVLAILTAAFATLYGHATILLMFVFPVPAKYFIGLEILFAFMAFLGGSPDKDLPGFLGICAAVAVTYSMLSGRGAGKILRQWRLQIERLVLEARLKRSRRGMRVVQGKHSPGSSGKDGKGGSSKGNGSVHKGPWIH